MFERLKEDIATVKECTEEPISSIGISISFWLGGFLNDALRKQALKFTPALR